MSFELAITEEVERILNTYEDQYGDLILLTDWDKKDLIKVKSLIDFAIIEQSNDEEESI